MTNYEAASNLLEFFDKYDIEPGSVYGIAIQTAIKSLYTEPKFFPPCVDCNKKMEEIRKAYDNRLKYMEDKDDNK